MRRRHRSCTFFLFGLVTPEDLGKNSTRNVRLDGDTFELSLTSGSGESTSSRTLIFRRST